MDKLVSMTRLPNGKTDANNQHLALLSTDLPEENWPWPTSGWEWRDRYAQRLRDYTLGLLWFAQNDEELPLHFRQACRQWGLASDEYPDNEGFPRQVYVREGRRLEGICFFTANDALPEPGKNRPPLHNSSITSSHYPLDSHAVRKREPGRVHLDGFFSYPTAVYTVPYGVIVPKVVENLLFPVAVSGSHVGFSTLRMEPCWMALGEAAGTAAAIAIERSKNVREVPVGMLQEKLLSHGATLVYMRDMKSGDPDFRSVQRLALYGFFPEWDAALDDILDESTAGLWSELSGTTVANDGKTTKREMMQSLLLQGKYMPEYQANGLTNSILPPPPYSLTVSRLQSSLPLRIICRCGFAIRTFSSFLQRQEHHSRLSPSLRMEIFLLINALPTASEFQFGRMAIENKDFFLPYLTIKS